MLTGGINLKKKLNGSPDKGGAIIVELQVGQTLKSIIFHLHSNVLALFQRVGEFPPPGFGEEEGGEPDGYPCCTIDNHGEGAPVLGECEDEGRDDTCHAGEGRE